MNFCLIFLASCCYFSTTWCQLLQLFRIIIKFFFFSFSFLLFIWLHGVLVAACGIFIATCGIFSCGMRDLQLWHVGSLVAACRSFSCGMWDIVPSPEIKPGPPELGVWSLSHWTTSEVPQLLQLCGVFIVFSCCFSGPPPPPYSDVLILFHDLQNNCYVSSPIPPKQTNLPVGILMLC